MYLDRNIQIKLTKSLIFNPVTAIVGSRQVGKTTISKHYTKQHSDSIYLDLEKTSDRNLLSDAERFFQINNNKLICLDEIQLMPNIFPIMRSIVDDEDYHIKFLITGSASPDLLRQTSESLAGRISYFELSPFLLTELKDTDINDYWLKGGFPNSLFANDNELSMDWRVNFIRTFLERDLRNFGFDIPPDMLNRLWKMLAHNNGQLLNYSQLSNSMGVSDSSIRKYIDILANTYMLRILLPYASNLKKRLIKSPKVYIRDTGILNALLNLDSMNEMLGHPTYGSSWELLCLENIIQQYPQWEPLFYRSSNGSEIDLILSKGNQKIAFEFKASTTPKVTRGFWTALEDIEATKAFIIAPVRMPYPYKNDVWIYPLQDFLKGNLI